MSDEKPVPETLETIATSIRDLRKSMDSRFDEAKAQLRTEIADVRTQLRADIEAVRDDVRLVAEAFGSQATINERNESAHTEFKKRLDDHAPRIAALERKSPDQTSA